VAHPELNIPGELSRSDALVGPSLSLVSAKIRQSRNILDEAVFGPIGDFIDESKNILNDLKDKMKREGGEERVNLM
jgi:hypothetical protein